ncbi:MAG: M20/M25/M40 family metallo-hydrolase [Bacteroidetes bacterium]|nr:M20/M25/M40 family metallo-hydrolase [Bacteroidota bacterium]
MKRTLVVLLLLSTECLVAQSDSFRIRQLANEILSNSKAYQNLRVLTKDIGGRLAGSPQMYQAEQWGFQALQQAGATTVWKQACMVPHWVRGGADKAMAITPGEKRNLDVVALGNSIGTGEKGLKAPVLLVNSFEDLEMKKDQVNGKIVFYNYPFNNTLIRTFEAYSDASKYRGQGPSRAAKYGAVAVIVRSMSHSTDNHPHTGSTRYDSAYAKIPAVAIGLQDADWLAQQLQTSELKVSMQTLGHFLPDKQGHNIIGELKGSEFPNEIITVGGHLDSWDNCEGAHDDGAGCVQTIEVLRAFKAIGYQPKRTIRFVLFANEENGLRGGNKYAEEANAKGERHVFALESDAGGFTPRGFGFTMSDEQFKKVSAWRSLIAPYGCNEFSLGGGGADIGPLNRTFKTPLAGLQPDSQRYFDYHHARNDTFEAVNKRELELGALNMAALILLVDHYGL